ncbi:sensor domain-containing diguanylate cyclase [Acinetobacter larvae]|uniref:GGDEF domain-containing protein n=1 Tax=Acinetobacter larvae TaxID=1789224 RepID=A0A1B2M236_9GAMM|nr:sensor domain-containing diguanylate cyclase [Acinetobacter larvae]AOA59260.1 hypothetical protein BFG52_13435 [Acinetobacter larvae]
MISRIYHTTSLQNIFKRSQLIVFALTFTVCSIVFLVISTYTMETYARQSLMILTDTLSERIQPAMVFNDKLTINQILNDYAEEFPIRSIQVVDTNHQELASISHQENTFISLNYILDRLFFNTPVTLDIQHNQQNFGQIIVYGNSSQLVDFFLKIIISLCLVLLIILAVLFWSVRTVYQYLMTSIRPVVDTAHAISEKKNYQLRFPPSEIKEFQDITIVFNQLLEKIQASNQQLQSENDLLFHQARHDELTQLPNRHYFYQQLFHIFSTVEKENSALMFIDNNNFKIINDHYGHLAGDAVLKEMAIRLRRNLRKDDFVARLGGDEFGVIIKDIKHEDNLRKISEHLLSCCTIPINYEGVEIYFSFSIGIAFFHCASTPEDVITAADSAMYKAKLMEQRWYISP